MTGGPAYDPARLAYRRLKTAAGVADLAALEDRVQQLESGVAESADLTAPLVSLVERIEGMLVPVLEARG